MCVCVCVCIFVCVNVCLCVGHGEKYSDSNTILGPSEKYLRRTQLQGEASGWIFVVAGGTGEMDGRIDINFLMI